MKSITCEEDLILFEKEAGYKCHNEHSRGAAYSLFLFIADNFLSSEEFEKSVVKYWTNLVIRMEKPVDKIFDPSAQKRAENGYVGLKNQGATCYMNAML